MAVPLEVEFARQEERVRAQYPTASANNGQPEKERKKEPKERKKEPKPKQRTWKAWRPEEDRVVRENYGLGPAKVAPMLDGRSVNAVKHRAVTLGVTAPKKGRESVTKQTEQTEQTTKPECSAQEARRIGWADSRAGRPCDPAAYFRAEQPALQIAYEEGWGEETDRQGAQYADADVAERPSKKPPNACQRDHGEDAAASLVAGEYQADPGDENDHGPVSEMRLAARAAGEPSDLALRVAALEKETGALRERLGVEERTRRDRARVQSDRTVNAEVVLRQQRATMTDHEGRLKRLERTGPHPVMTELEAAAGPALTAREIPSDVEDRSVAERLSDFARRLVRLEGITESLSSHRLPDRAGGLEKSLVRLTKRHRKLRKYVARIIFALDARYGQGWGSR